SRMWTLKSTSGLSFCCHGEDMSCELQLLALQFGREREDAERRETEERDTGDDAKGCGDESCDKRCAVLCYKRQEARCRWTYENHTFHVKRVADVLAIDYWQKIYRLPFDLVLALLLVRDDVAILEKHLLQRRLPLRRTSRQEFEVHGEMQELLFLSRDHDGL